MKFAGALISTIAIATWVVIRVALSEHRDVRQTKMEMAAN